MGIEVRRGQNNPCCCERADTAISVFMNLLRCCCDEPRSTWKRYFSLWLLLLNIGIWCWQISNSFSINRSIPPCLCTKGNRNQMELPTWIYGWAEYMHIYTQTHEFNSNNNNLINFQNFIKTILNLDLNACIKLFKNVCKYFVLSVPQNNNTVQSEFFTCPTHGNEEPDIYCRNIPSVVIFPSSQSYVAGSQLFCWNLQIKQHLPQQSNDLKEFLHNQSFWLLL